MNCFGQSSLRDENSSYISEDIVEELLFYVSELKTIKDVKAKIEKECGIKNKDTWSVKDIKDAWRESKMRTSRKRNNWSCVIVLEELKRRVRDDKNNERKEAEPDLKVNEDMQAFGTAQREEDTGSRLFVSNTDLKIAGDASQAAELLQNTVITEQNVGQQPQYIRIPFSDMSEENPEMGEIVSTNTPYKLINGYPSENEIRKKKSYVISYNNVTNNADWVYEILNASTLANNCEKELKLGDTNYHKGHLAAAANHKWCLEALNDASLSINKAPQQKKLNQSIWKKLENACRKAAEKETVRNLHVYTGPLYPEEQTMMGGKALPSHFFKVILVEKHNGRVKPHCFCIPNEQPTSDDFKVNRCSIEHIESRSNLNFICTPPGETEDRINTINWQGKNEADEICNANIKVRISS